MPAAIVRSAATLGLERLMLMSLALVLSLAACQEPEQATGPSLSQSALPNSITLTYICGNAFRVRNTNPTVMTVTWDVYQKGETGSLTLPAKPSTGPYSETYFTTVNKGTVRLFLDGVLIQTKANGNKPACQLPVDTTRPAVPAYGFPIDSGYLSPMTVDSAIYFRRLLLISFQASASGATINQVFSKYSAVIVGGLPWSGDYIVQVPDPGEPIDSLLALRDRISAESGVEFVILVNYRSPPPIVHARFPVDGSGFTRASWGGAGGTDPAWGLKAIRAPLAWGCENGIDGPTLIDIGVVEWQFQPLFDGDDFPTTPRPTMFSATGAGYAPESPSQGALLTWHGTAVAGMLAARADNQKGVPGVMWNSRLHLYAVGRPTALPMDQVTTLVGEVFARLAMDRPRVVNLSLELAKSSLEPGLPGYIAKQLQQLLTQVPSMLIVKATGNDGVVLTPAALAALPGGGFLLDDALVRVRQAGFRDRIVMVGGSEPTSIGSGVQVGGAFTFIDGETDIVAPARGIRVLAGTPLVVGVVDTTGTSFAAPMVAGVAAQLLAMQPNLSPAQVKQYIVDGAQEPRLDPNTGLTIGREQLRLHRSGATQTVFQLDAYGSLTKLSREDPATPICGFPVITSFVTNPETSEIETVVRLARPNHYQSVYQGNVENVTVAQGGRRIGIDVWGESRNVDFQNYSWSVGSPMAFRGYRQFLERDTAFTDYSSGSALLNIRGPNADRGPFDICAGLPMPVLPEFGPYCQLGPIASTGEWVHATTDRSNSDITGCGPGRAFYGSYLVPVGSSGTRQVLREVSSDPCPPEELGVVFSGTGSDVLAWRGDGAVAWVAHPSWSGYRAWGFDDPLDPNPPPKVFVPTALQTSFEQVSTVAGVAALGPRSVSDRLTYALGWRSDGAALISYESLGLDWTECQRAVRAGLAPEIQVTDSAGSVPFCANAVMEPLAAPRLMSALGAALRPMATVHSGRFAESRIHTPRRRTVQPMVLVN